jgi:putative transposase
MSVRKQYSPEFKSKVVLEILKEEKTPLSDIIRIRGSYHSVEKLEKRSA